MYFSYFSLFLCNNGSIGPSSLLNEALSNETILAIEEVIYIDAYLGSLLSKASSPK